MRGFAFIRRLNKVIFIAAILFIIMLTTCFQPSFGAFTWQKLTGSTPDKPAISLRLESSSWLMYIAVRASDNSTVWTYLNTTSGEQAQWHQEGGSTPSGPAVFRTQTSTFLATRGMDDGIYWKSAGESSWHKLSGSTLSGPAIFVNETENIMYVLTSGEDNGVYWCNVSLSSPYTQGPWHKLTGTTLDSPSFSLGGGYMWIATRGMDNGTYWCQVLMSAPYTQGTWHKLTGSTPSSPAISYLDSGHISVEVRSSDNSIKYCVVTIADNSHEWKSMDGNTSSGPAMQTGSSLLFSCARGMDNGIYCTWTTQAIPEFSDILPATAALALVVIVTVGVLRKKIQR